MISPEDIEQSKSVVAFLERVGLSGTLKVFKSEWGSLTRSHEKINEGAPNDTSTPSRTPIVDSLIPHHETDRSTESSERPSHSAATGPEKQPRPKPSTASKLGIETIVGTEEDIWDVGEEGSYSAPEFPHGVGLPLQQYEAVYRKEVRFVPCTPYQKEPPPSNLPLESFDLRVIYEAGRTGFEESKDFPIVVNSVIAGRYQVLQYLDSAAFSRAVKCLDLKHGHEVCIKIIRNSKDFFDQSLDEIKLLQQLNYAGDAEEHCILQLFDYFYYKEHIFIVCELLRDNLYEFGKYNREQETEPYFTLPRVQHIARQVLRALAFLHKQKLIHCDLKPENILVKSYSRCEVKVIDFGSSCFTTDNLSSYIQSRCYRAPEVILGCHYDQRIDIWSLGAILPELMTGQVLFHNHSVAGMLARIAGICGPFAESMLHSGRHSCRFVTTHGVFYEVSQETGELLFHFPACQPLRSMDLGSSDPLFIDFVEKCLTIDYLKRPTAMELLQHEFIMKDYGPVYSAPPPLKKAAKSPMK
jgi:serine/threonine protein kinase